MLPVVELHEVHLGPFLQPDVQHTDCSPVLTLPENLQREHSFPLPSSLYRHCTILVLVGTSEIHYKEVAAICTSDPESPPMEPEGSDFPPSFMSTHSVDLSPISL